MFETEDMLPRAAPKPSAQLSEAVGSHQPVVPEVSILYGQLEPSGGVKSSSCTAAATAQPSYAAWKKQVLPKVCYPPPIVEATTCPEHMSATSVSPRPNVYPLRPNTAPLVSASAAQTGYNEALLQQHNHRRSLDSVASAYSTPPLTLGERGYASTNGGGYYAPHCRSLDHAVQLSSRTQSSTRSTASEVLTICAGTQTNGVSPPTEIDSSSGLSLRHVASKQDVAELQGVIQAMRDELLRLSQMCEALLMERQHFGAPPRVFLKDVATQWEPIADNPARRSPVYQSPMPEYNATGQCDEVNTGCAMRLGTNNRFRHFQSPRASPQAQSTAYRQNTPGAQQPPPHSNSPLAKSNSEKTLVMNELALKYLPNEKLNELMQELDLAHPAAQLERAPADTPLTPLRAMENVERRPSDISNASYRYLKKYRLLPDVPNGYAYEQQQHEEEEEDIECCRHSPYPRSASPLAGVAATPSSAQHPKMVNLEGLRNKPKFL